MIEILFDFWVKKCLRDRGFGYRSVCGIGVLGKKRVCECLRDKCLRDRCLRLKRGYNNNNPAGWGGVVLDFPAMFFVLLRGGRKGGPNTMWFGKNIKSIHVLNVRVV